MAERFGMEGRGRFYEETGAIRDVLHNHLLQVVACLAMDAPASRAATARRDERARVLQAITPLTPGSVVRGQFRGYHDEPGVAADSRVETFVAVHLHVDSKRWARVPFYLRAGKCLPVTCTEVLVVLKPPSRAVFGETPPGADQANYRRFRLGPDMAMALGMRTKKPGEAMAGQEVELLATQALVGAMDPYERLIGDAMRGESTLFVCEEAAEAAWRVVEPILGEVTPLYPYQAGTWGPAEAAGLLSHAEGWRTPMAALLRQGC